MFHTMSRPKTNSLYVLPLFKHLLPVEPVPAFRDSSNTSQALAGNLGSTLYFKWEIDTWFAYSFHFSMKICCCNNYCLFPVDIYHKDYYSWIPSLDITLIVVYVILTQVNVLTVLTQ